MNNFEGGDNLVEEGYVESDACTLEGRLSKLDPHTSPGNGPRCTTSEDTKAKEVR